MSDEKRKTFGKKDIAKMNGLQCPAPKCDAFGPKAIRVIDVYQKRGGYINRVRKCVECGRVFLTTERIIDEQYMI